MSGRTHGPRVSVGMIVLNGEPFTISNLRGLYPFVHQIVVVEGAGPWARDAAAPDGHSQDGTLDRLRRFKEEEDPDGKLVVVTAEDEGHPDGFWPGEKDEQSRAYAKRADGEYLWQVDVDEFYLEEDIRKLLDMLRNDPSITQINVPQINFWGGFGYVVDGFHVRHFYDDLGGGVPRVFKWGPGYRYATHRPPTVEDDRGRDLRSLRWVKGQRLRRLRLYCHHYNDVFVERVRQRVAYYRHHTGHAGLERWFLENYLGLAQPFRVHMIVRQMSWLKRYRGRMPATIKRELEQAAGDDWEGAGAGRQDVERLLASSRYRAGVVLLEAVAPFFLRLQDWVPRWTGRFERVVERCFSPAPLPPADRLVAESGTQETGKAE